jgi:glycerol-3-phosphate dehydrogenase (NAD(P)+)
MDSICVIGAGKWGQALHYALSQKQKCLITSRTKKDIKDFVTLDEALDCKYLVIAIPAQSIRSWLEENFHKSTKKNQKILVAAKGIEASSGKFLKEIYEQFVLNENLGFISGPSFASEVIKGLPTALVLNSTSKKFYDEFSPLFPSFIKTYYSDDVIGAEIAGAYKNVLAIASGICDGLKLAQETIGRPIPNTPVLGAFMKVSGMFPIEEFKNAMRAVLGKLPGKIIDANMLAIQRAYDEVQ